MAQQRDRESFDRLFVVCVLGWATIGAILIVFAGFHVLKTIGLACTVGWITAWVIDRWSARWPRGESPDNH